MTTLNNTGETKKQNTLSSKGNTKQPHKQNIQNKRSSTSETSSTTLNHLTGDNDMKDLFNEFNCIYQRRIKGLEESELVETEQIKVQILEEWIQDLSDQNQTLIDTVKELEVESSRRVECLETKLEKDAFLTRSHMTNMRESQLQHELLLHDRSAIEEQLKVLHEEVEAEHSVALALQADKSKFETDINTIVKFMKNGRETNDWSTSNLSLCSPYANNILQEMKHLKGNGNRSSEFLVDRQSLQDEATAERNIALALQEDKSHLESDMKKVVQFIQQGRETGEWNTSSLYLCSPCGIRLLEEIKTHKGGGNQLDDILPNQQKLEQCLYEKEKEINNLQEKLEDLSICLIGNPEITVDTNMKHIGTLEAEITRLNEMIASRDAECSEFAVSIRDMYLCISKDVEALAKGEDNLRHLLDKVKSSHSKSYTWSGSISGDSSDFHLMHSRVKVLEESRGCSQAELLKARIELQRAENHKKEKDIQIGIYMKEQLEMKGQLRKLSEEKDRAWENSLSFKAELNSTKKEYECAMAKFQKMKKMLNLGLELDNVSLVDSLDVQQCNTKTPVTAEYYTKHSKHTKLKETSGSADEEILNFINNLINSPDMNYNSDQIAKISSTPASKEVEEKKNTKVTTELSKKLSPPSCLGALIDHVGDTDESGDFLLLQTQLCCRDSEIQNQQLTINNLKDALIESKREVDKLKQHNDVSYNLVPRLQKQHSILEV